MTQPTKDEIFDVLLQLVKTDDARAVCPCSRQIPLDLDDLKNSRCCLCGGINKEEIRFRITHTENKEKENN